ncbi:MAG: phosphoribosylanthranilate isomerase [Thermodesulfobacteriota bacterium]
METRTRIKICGICEMSDARVAVEAGVDALGFIFAPASPRRIDPEKARDIIASLPPFVDAVGVFMDEELAHVEEIVQFCGLTTVQLHGSESPEYCNELDCRVMKAFRISAERLDSGEVDFGPYYGAVEGFLLDTYHRQMAGGTGQPFDWRLLERVKPAGPVILAGGLTPENVATAIQLVRPFAVDANSGVEEAPGRKGHDAIRRLVRAVRQADAALSAASSDGQSGDGI